MTNFLQSVLNYEQQGINRQAILLLVKEQIAQIDLQRKDIKLSISEDIESLGAVEGTKACNAICPPTGGSDGAARSRLQRRRVWLKGLLASVHSSYDFTLEAGTINCAYIGDANERQANSIFAVLEKLVSMDVLASLPCTREDILAGIKSQSNEGLPKNILTVDDATVTAIQAVATKAAEIAAKLALPLEKEALKVKQA